MLNECRVATLLFVAVFLGTDARAEDLLQLDIIDVGEGDAILVRASGKHAALIDAGNFITGEMLPQVLEKSNLSALDHFILTHPHPDHIGGVFSVFQHLTTRAIYDNGQDLTVVSEQDIFRWYRDLVRGDRRYRKLVREDRLRMGEASLDVLWPPAGSWKLDWNTNSLVLMVRYGKFRALLMGDGNTETERGLLELNEDLSADVLKAGHHGASDTCLPEFIARVDPKIAAVSVNSRNIRGYPASTTLDCLGSKGAKVLRTDMNGTISLRSGRNGEKVMILPSRAS